jgi:hypothetical protein
VTPPFFPSGFTTSTGIIFPIPFFIGPYYGYGSVSGLAAGLTGDAYFDLGSAGYEYFYSGGQSFNGFDNTNSGVVNNPNDQKTTPPYPVPLRGVQIKIRVYEPSTRQVREITVSETFLPD